MILSILLPISQLAAEVTDILQIIDDIEYITQKHKEGVDKLDTSLLKTLSIESIKYNKGETLVCLIEKENLIIKRQEKTKKSDIEDHNILMMVDHENVVKTFLTIQAKKGDMTIEYSISPYYEEEVKMSTFESPKDLLDYLKQLATGISHLHGKNIKHGDIKIENTRLTYYNKTITTEQREFIVKSFDTLEEKFVKRPKGDSLNKTEADNECDLNKLENDQLEENVNGLAWLNVYKNGSLLNSVLSLEKTQKNNEPTYVLINLDEEGYFDADKLYEDLTKQITKLKVDIHKYESLETLWEAELWKRAKELGIVHGSETLQESEQLKIWEMIFDVRESNRWKKWQYKVLYKSIDALEDFKRDCVRFGSEYVGNIDIHYKKRCLDEFKTETMNTQEIKLEEKVVWMRMLELEQKKYDEKIKRLEDFERKNKYKSLKEKVDDHISRDISSVKDLEEQPNPSNITKSDILRMFRVLKNCQNLNDAEKSRELENDQVRRILLVKNISFWSDMWKFLEDVTRSITIKKLTCSKLLEKRNELRTLENLTSPSYRIYKMKKFTRIDIYEFATTFFECSMQFMPIYIDNILSNKTPVLSTKNLSKIFGDPKDPVEDILSQCTEIDVNQMATMCEILKNFPTEDEYKKYLQQLAASKKKSN